MLAAWIRLITAIGWLLAIARKPQWISSSMPSSRVWRSRPCRAGLALGGGSCLYALPSSSSIRASSPAAAGPASRGLRCWVERLVDVRLLHAGSANRRSSAAKSRLCATGDRHAAMPSAGVVLEVVELDDPIAARRQRPRAARPFREVRRGVKKLGLGERSSAIGQVG